MTADERIEVFSDFEPTWRVPKSQAVHPIKVSGQKLEVAVQQVGTERLVCRPDVLK